MRKTVKFLFNLVALPMIAAVENTKIVAPNSKLMDRLNKIAGQGGYDTSASTPVVVGTIISAFLGFVGIIFIVLIILAGIGWMRAQGSQEEIKKARETIKEALIGLVISMSAYAIWNFIFKRIIAG